MKEQEHSMSEKSEKTSDELINEWMRSNDAFKRLARQYGKGGKPKKLRQSQEHDNVESGLVVEILPALKDKDSCVKRAMPGPGHRGA
jgi:hypothetical protein